MGLQGTAGVTGPQGTQGNAGTNGTNGTNGTTGPQGGYGSQGPVGNDSTVPGPQGNQGPQGDASTVAGPQGPQGGYGSQGPVGNDSTVPGPQGNQGPQGDASTVAGPQGPTGSGGGGSGITMYYDNSASTTTIYPSVNTAIIVQLGPAWMSALSGTNYTIDMPSTTTSGDWLKIDYNQSFPGGFGSDPFFITFATSATSFQPGPGSSTLFMYDVNPSSCNWTSATFTGSTRFFDP
jgi:hypothetical protein